MNRKRKVLLLLTAIAALQLPRPALSSPTTLTLEECLDRVLEHNPRVKRAEHEAAAASARVGQQKSAYLPHIDATAVYGHRDPVPEMAIGGGEPLAFAPLDSYDARISARMLLLDFGRTAKRVALARSAETSASHRLELTGRRLSFSTVERFYTILFLKEAVIVQKKEIEALERSLNFMQKRYDEGVSTRFDLLATEVRLRAASNRKTGLQNELRNEELLLRRLCVIDGDEPLELEGSFELPQPLPAGEEQLLSAHGQRVEIRLAEEHGRAAEHRASLASREGLPELSGSASWGTSNAYQPDLYEMRENVATGVELRIPIFSGFRTSAMRREATALRLAAQDELDDARSKAATELRQAANSLETSRDRIATATLQVEQARLAAEHARIRYRNGLATTLDLLDTEATLAEAELGHLRARYTFIMNRYALRYAAGAPLLAIPEERP